MRAVSALAEGLCGDRASARHGSPHNLPGNARQWRGARRIRCSRCLTATDKLDDVAARKIWRHARRRSARVLWHPSSRFAPDPDCRNEAVAVQLYLNAPIAFDNRAAEIFGKLVPVRPARRDGPAIRRSPAAKACASRSAVVLRSFGKHECPLRMGQALNQTSHTVIAIEYEARAPCGFSTVSVPYQQQCFASRVL